MKIPKDSPTKVGDRVIKRGRPGIGVVRSLLSHPGWMETIWEDGSDNPTICHQSELQRIEA